MASNSDPQSATNTKSGIGRWVLLATITASSMAFIDSTALNVALDSLQRDLKATGAELIWISNAYTLLLAALILLGGSLGDRFGRNRIFRHGILLFSAASFMCGVAPTVGVLIAARAVQGIGGALMVPGSLAIIAASFPAAERGRAIGTWSAFGTITTIFGPALGGVLAGAGLWRGVFFLNLPLALISLYALTRVPETKNEQAPRQLDYLGTVLITLGLAGLSYGAVAFGQVNEAGSTEVLPLIAIVVGVLALIGFMVVESRSDHPLVPLGLFRQRTFSGTNLLTLFLYGALAGVTFFVPLNLIQVQKYPASLAGLTFLPLSLAIAVLSPIMGGMVTRFGPRRLLTLGPLLVGVSFALMALPGVTNGPSDYWTTFFPAVIMLGIGLGVTIAPLTTAVMGSVPSHESGVASGVNNAVTRTAQSLAVAILGAVALFSFTGALTGRTAQLGLPPAAQQELRQNAGKLGSVPVPAGIEATQATGITEAVRLAFVDMFRLVAGIGVVLCVLSAVAAFILVEDKLPDADKIKNTA